MDDRELDQRLNMLQKGIETILIFLTQKKESIKEESLQTKARENKYKVKDKKCVKCGTEKNLKKVDMFRTHISEDSNPNTMTFHDCYVCVDCWKRRV